MLSVGLEEFNTSLFYSLSMSLPLMVPGITIILDTMDNSINHDGEPLSFEEEQENSSRETDIRLNDGRIENVYATVSPDFESDSREPYDIAFERVRGRSDIERTKFSSDFRALLSSASKLSALSSPRASLARLIIFEPTTIPSAP